MVKRVRTRTKKFAPIPKERALISIPIEPVVEQPVEVIAEDAPPPYVPRLMELYELRKEESIFDAPDSPNPYWLIDKDDVFIHKHSLIGRSITKSFFHAYQRILPKVKKKEEAAFWWGTDVAKIPANLSAQIVDFFRRTYANISAEAEVILLLSLDKQTWKLWIPAQKVSGTSVNSRYEPENIPDGFLVVGSMHSHCMMGAFHSGVDTGDAKEFDGVHLTIGKVKNDMPEINAMIMINKVQFSIDFNRVADFSNLEAAKAPAFWDDFVATSGNTPKRDGHLFTKYPDVPRYTPPTTTPTWQPGAPTKRWTPPNHQQGGVSTKPFGQQPQHQQTFRDDGWDVDDEFFNLYAGWRYDVSTNAWVPRGEVLDDVKSDDSRWADKDDQRWGRSETRRSSLVWDDITEKQIKDVFDSDLFTDENYQDLYMEAGTKAKEYLQALFIIKMDNVVDILKSLDMEVTAFDIKPKEKVN